MQTEDFDAAPGGSFIDAIVALKAYGSGDGPLTLGRLIDGLDKRAFGLSILILAIPCLVPGLPGAQLIAIPIFLLALQVAIGRREPWLPGAAMRATVRPGWLNATADFADMRLRWAERLSRPRWRFIANPAGDRITGLILAIAAITIMLPITNTVPSLAVTLAAVGLLQRDGVFMAAGMLVAVGWVTALAIIVFGLVTGAGFAVDLIRDHASWLLDLFR